MTLQWFHVELINIHIVHLQKAIEKTGLYQTFKSYFSNNFYLQ